MDLQSFLDSLLANAGLVYLLLFVIMFAEGAGAPIPGFSLALIAGALAGQGKLEIWLVVATSVIGNTLGGFLGYWIGLRGGRRLLERFGKYIFLTPARLAKSESYVARHGAKAMLFSRYLPVLCFMFGIVGGIVRQPFGSFAWYSTLGVLTWAASHLTAAYFFGRSIEALLNVVNNVGLVITALVVLAILYIGIKYYFARRAANQAMKQTTPKIAEATLTPVTVSADKD